MHTVANDAVLQTLTELLPYNLFENEDVYPGLDRNDLYDRISTSDKMAGKGGSIDE